MYTVFWFLWATVLIVIKQLVLLMGYFLPLDCPLKEVGLGVYFLAFISFLVFMGFDNIRERTFMSIFKTLLKKSALYLLLLAFFDQLTAFFCDYSYVLGFNPMTRLLFTILSQHLFLLLMVAIAMTIFYYLKRKLMQS